MTAAQTHTAPRFPLGQTVKIIANHGGLYAAQIGVIGVVSKRRQMRLGHRSYDVSYHDAKGREKRVIVREEDLEAVEATEAVEAVEAAGEAAPAPPTPATQPSTIPTTVPPRFAIGQQVTVHPASTLAYETWTRKGAVGEIEEIGRPVRGVRRYTVRYNSPHISVHRTRIREEHLLLAPLPATDLPAADLTPDDDPVLTVRETPPEPPADRQTVIIERNDGTVEIGEVRSASVVITERDDGTVTFACARGSRGATPTCEHDWFEWPDGRYRICAKCKQAERVTREVSP